MAKVTIREGYGRPWSEALFTKLSDAVEADPQFRAEFKTDPLAAVRARFGADALPAEGITIVHKKDGGLLFILPPGEGVWELNANLEATTPSLSDETSDEIPDELLEFVSAGGGGTVGPVTPTEKA